MLDVDALDVDALGVGVLDDDLLGVDPVLVGCSDTDEGVVGAASDACGMATGELHAARVTTPPAIVTIRARLVTDRP
ncbi:hypothetical protein ATK17_1336 [Branchiibius hedensis]|uniref:Uncharacterized protein n=1 Tax=Branchiibius hedensis TaxID=672460 RepID=A0A2Y8ZRH8_9MICO|nr:hypothetical protein ATK17_1336 [Branchiibius hedensis]SSA34036.1 hypothetical protein SAMN04489750_1336 [Branchiibius hedensis]